MIIREREYEWEESTRNGDVARRDHDLRDVQPGDDRAPLRAYIRPAWTVKDGLDVLVRSGTLMRGYFDVLTTLPKGATIEQAKAIAEAAILLGLDTADRGDVA